MAKILLIKMLRGEGIVNVLLNNYVKNDRLRQ